MIDITRKTRTIEGVSPDRIPYDQLMDDQEAVILKGVAADWPLVRAGLQSPLAAIDQLKACYQGRPVTAYTAEPAVGGRFFYNADFSGLNYAATRVRLDAYLDEIASHIDVVDSPAFYIGSTDPDIFLPGLRDGNNLVFNHAMFERNPPLPSVWIGSRTIATAHYDMSHNLAVCVAGRRRFSLFPPGQVENLYPGPLEPTPGGQVVSMVDFRRPDFELYPRFRDAQAAGEVAELEPGDVLFYPALWWHHVEALESFNILMNFWWNTTPAFMDTPMNSLLLSLLSLRDRPQAEKDSWRAMFEYYVFGPAEKAGAHLPDHIKGALGPLDEMKARRLRAMLLAKLNR